MQTLIDELHQHTDIKDIEDQIIQYAYNCRSATPPPVRQKPDCIEFVKGRASQWLLYRPTPQETDALTKLWRTYIPLIVKQIGKWDFPQQEKRDLLMDSYELIQLAVSNYHPTMGSLRYFMMRKIKKTVSNAASHYARRNDLIAHEITDDPPEAIQVNHISLDDFAKRVGVYEEFTELMDTAHNIYDRFI